MSVAAHSEAAATGGSVDRRFVNRLGVLVGLAGITMLFAAFTSAYIVRSGGADWVALDAPPVLWFGTALLLLSSVALERARRAFGAGRLSAFRNAMLLTAALGTGFLACQLASWRALADAGVYLQSHPKSSFFFVLTGVHGAHLLGGLAAVLIVAGLAAFGRLAPGRSDAPNLVAIYWHFVGGLWAYLLAVLFLLG